ncbi:MAG: adenylate kinase [Anaerolineales bacterium]|nr:MAG: adenylate kinase [Anaerolineales bacterium]
MPVYVVLLGPPGAGKGTQAGIVAKAMGLAHISSGDLFREHIKNQTDLGKRVDAILKRGDLVPDDVTIAMIRERLKQPDCANGAILDGFPRTPAQAQALNGMLAEFGGEVDVVPYIQVEEAELIDRLSDRWVCRAHGHVYNANSNPPKTAGVCDIDGSELYQRDDDKRETVEKRIRVYFEQTAPLIEHYRGEGRLVDVNGAQEIAQVTEDLLKALPGQAK